MKCRLPAAKGIVLKLLRIFSPRNAPAQQTLTTAKNGPATSLEEKQELLAHHVRLVTKGCSNGLFVAGAGGLGKSRTIASTLCAENVNPTLINSHITPLSLFQTLYANRKEGRVVWLDDCDSIYGNLAILGLLRSALWGGTARVVTYNSSQTPDGIPNRFEFAGRIIFCANSIPTRNEAFKAVLSRVDCFELNATNDELIELMGRIATSGYKSLTPDQCAEVVDFIAGFEGNRTLSMRLYEPSLEKRIYAQQQDDLDWRRLIRCQLDQLGTKSPPPVSDIELLRQIVEANSRVGDQERIYCEQTSKSRASFFRLKRKLATSEPVIEGESTS